MRIVGCKADQRRKGVFGSFLPLPVPMMPGVSRFIGIGNGNGLGICHIVNVD